MKFEPTEQQKMLADQARRMLTERSAPDRLRALIDAGAEWDEPLWQAIAEMGFLGAHLPEKHGGLGMGALDLAVISEELGRANAALPFFSSIVLAAEAIALAGSDEQKARTLPRLASGETIATLGYGESWDAGDVGVTLDGGKLNGEISPVADAGIADLAVILASEAGTLRLALVDLRADGVTRTKLKSFDQLRAHYRLNFDRTPATPLPGKAADILPQIFDRAAVQAAFEAVGAADACIAMARDYAMERQIFGRPLASYQAIKHKLADLATAAEMARSSALHAAWTADNDPDRLSYAASGARLMAIAAFESAARENLQVHGGIGYTMEADCHFYYRRERTVSLSLGGREYWADRLIASRPDNTASPDAIDINAEDSEEEAAFRADAQAWLKANAPEFEMPATEKWPDTEQARMGRLWQSRLQEGGYGSIMLPKALGGRGGTLMEAMIFNEEEGRYRMPKGPYIKIGLNMALPAIAKHGTAEQIARFTQPTLQGEITWCQLFSEPSAGSDLAGLRTRAVKDGDDWIVNGQKVWSSWAHLSDWGILLARTDPSLPKHKGLTFFVLDMKTPGVEVRPIKQISGESDFNETFLADVRIPDSCRIGDVGEGWACAMTVLMGERLGSGGTSNAEGGVNGLLKFARDAERGKGSLLDDAHIRTALGQYLAEEEAEAQFQARLRSMVASGDNPGALAGMVKLAHAGRMQKSSGFAMEMRGLGGIAHEADDSDSIRIWHDYIWATALRVAGGADEVLRNQISERVLGMPGEIRTDKNVPFEQLK